MAVALCTEYTPVRARRGKQTHALALTAHETVCGERVARRGWIVSRFPFNCRRCVERLTELIIKQKAKVKRTRSRYTVVS